MAAWIDGNRPERKEWNKKLPRESEWREWKLFCVESSPKGFLMGFFSFGLPAWPHSPLPASSWGEFIHHQHLFPLLVPWSTWCIHSSSFPWSMTGYIMTLSLSAGHFTAPLSFQLRLTAPSCEISFLLILASISSPHLHSPLTESRSKQLLPLNPPSVS